jgi:hypothetical protein
MEIEKLSVYARGWQQDEKEILNALESWEKSSPSLMEDCLPFYCYMRSPEVRVYGKTLS